MKTLICLGLVLFSVLFAVALRRDDAPPRSVFESETPAGEPGRNSRAADAHGDWPSRGRQASPQSEDSAFAAETDHDRRSEIIERIVQSVSDADLPTLLDSLTDDTSPEAAELSPLLLRRWAESDILAAAAWTSRLPRSPGYRDAVKQVAIIWAQTDLSAAADWVGAMPEGASKEAATFALAYEAARTEPISALNLASPLPPTSERDDLLVHAISQWAGTDFAAAEAWAVRVADPVLQQRVVAAMAVAVAEADGAFAATFAADLLEAGTLQDHTVVAIVQRWAQNSPEAAASWVSQFPDLPSRDPAVQNLLTLWTVQDSEAADNWLRELPDGPLREAGRAAYAQVLAVSGEPRLRQP